MQRTDDNMNFCRAQIRRFENTAFYSTLSFIGLAELANTLCDVNDTQLDAQVMVDARLHDTSLTPRGEIRGGICPSAADFSVMAEARRRDALAAVSWQPDRSLKDEHPWTAEERRRHDEWFASWLKDFDMKAARARAAKGLRPVAASIGRVVPMAPNKTSTAAGRYEREPGDESESEYATQITYKGDMKR